ncbi:hypothetical protein [Xanthovirga aplysinae]|uniref:hypothetical protein n=1 Tax=Xanthovirga aplysinae TaxID=2529853 RepID=UPI0012BD1F18|nr:hypothetical protein [Xanthovirga aplysinae]MTI30208.1 hypothetical protein [Xanthovirga aplysinae]
MESLQVTQENKNSSLKVVENRNAIMQAVSSDSCSFPDYSIELLHGVFEGAKKAGIIKVAQSNAREYVEQGQYDLLPTLIGLKKIQTYIDSFLSEEAFQAAALAEAQTHGKKDKELKGSKISIGELGTKYDFKADSEWNKLDKEIKTITQKRKDHEKFLKSLSSKVEVLDDETGQVFPHFPPTKSSKTGLKVTL